MKTIGKWVKKWGNDLHLATAGYERLATALIKVMFDISLPLELDLYTLEVIYQVVCEPVNLITISTMLTNFLQCNLQKMRLIFNPGHWKKFNLVLCI